MRKIETPEDYTEYLADKSLHEAYKVRAELCTTHSYTALVRKWADHIQSDKTPEQPPKP